MLFEAYCVFGYREFYKNLLCILMEVNKTMYGNNEGVPDKLLVIFLMSSPGIRNHMNRQVRAPNPVFPQSYRTILNKQEFIIHNSVTRPVQYSLSTMPTFLGELATLDLLTLMKSLNESYVPKAVLKPRLGIDLIQKCLWILRKKFNFQTTKN
jgi:hypothetical protein